VPRGSQAGWARAGWGAGGLGRGRRVGERNWLISVGNDRTCTASAVELFLLAFPAGRLVVRRAPLRRTLLTMLLTAPERAAQDGMRGISRMRQKANPAVAAGTDALLQPRINGQHSVQSRLIVPHQAADALILMPVPAERESLRHAYDKRLRFSVMIRSGSVMPPSYDPKALVARGTQPTRAFPYTEPADAANSTDKATKTYAHHPPPLSSGRYTALQSTDPCSPPKSISHRNRAIISFFKQWVSLSEQKWVNSCERHRLWDSLAGQTVFF